MPTTVTPPNFGGDPPPESGPGCSLCGRCAQEHACPVAPELADHFTSAEFYRACAGDQRVHRYLYPEAFTR